MPVESWMKPEDTAAFAAQAMTQIDSVLSRLPETDRMAFWASIRKCYNTPYNDPKPRVLSVPDVMEASATTAHSATSITDLPVTDIAAAERPQFDMTMGAILGRSPLWLEAHPP
ncbi:hypothetical protein AIGOOFII_3877 [Methylobacterium marchantiae]|nr:hypothetical protein AIGOOFII_3877 [Methylobacterium marchantiae]